MPALQGVSGLCLLSQVSGDTWTRSGLQMLHTCETDLNRKVLKNPGHQNSGKRAWLALPPMPHYAVLLKELRAPAWLPWDRSPGPLCVTFADLFSAISLWYRADLESDES